MIALQLNPPLFVVTPRGDGIARISRTIREQSLMEILRQAARLFGRKNPQYETLTEVTFNGEATLKVRVWRAAKTLDEAKAFDHGRLKGHIGAVINNYPVEKWQGVLMQLPNVACVAIVNASGDGVSSYPDWH